MFDTRTRLFFFACQKETAGAALEKAERLRPTKNRLRLRPKSGGSALKMAALQHWFLLHKNVLQIKL